MVSTVFKKEELALLLNLPKTETNEKKQAKNKILNIELSKEKIAFNGRIINFEEFENQLESIEDKMKPVFLRIDEIVQYKRVVKVLDLLKKNKLTNLSLITKKDH